MHDLSLATFQFYVDLDRRLSPEQEGLWRDAAIIARILDDAEWPIPFHEMIDVMNDRGRETTALERDIDEPRARIALAQFRREECRDHRLEALRSRTAQRKVDFANLPYR